MRIVLFTCALTLTACGGADTPPAQDPSSVNSPANTSLTGAPAQAAATEASPPAQTPPSAMPAPATWQARDTPAVVSPTAPSSASDSNVRGPGPAAAVANNPGSADQTSGADNTKVNDRDRHGTLTPMNQGNGSDETRITAAIRKGIVGDKSLSFTAKNVKIITIGTKVTLRGPVNSDQEKATIEARAKQTPGVTDVDDQLEVKK